METQAWVRALVVVLVAFEKGGADYVWDGEQWQWQDVPTPVPSSCSPAPAKGPQSASEGPHPHKQPLGGEKNVFAQSHILTAVVGGRDSGSSWPALYHCPPHDLSLPDAQGGGKDAGRCTKKTRTRGFHCDVLN